MRQIIETILNSFATEISSSFSVLWMWIWMFVSLVNLSWTSYSLGEIYVFSLQWGRKCPVSSDINCNVRFTSSSLYTLTTWWTITLVQTQLTRAVKVIQLKQPFQVIVPFAIKVAITVLMSTQLQIQHWVCCGDVSLATTSRKRPHFSATRVVAYEKGNCI